MAPSSTGSYHVTALKPHDPSKVVVKLSLSTQNVYVMEGDRLLMAVQGNVGKPGAPTPTGNFTIIDKDKTNAASASPMRAIRWHTGVSLGLPMDSTKDLSILIRTPTAASGCIVKPPPGFSRWPELVHRCISRTRFPRTPSTAARYKSLIKAAIPIRPVLL